MLKRYPFADNRTTRILFGLFMLAMLYLSRDAMPCMTFLGFYPSQFLTVGLMGLMGVVFIVNNRKNLKEVFTDSRIILMAVFTATFLLPMAAKRDMQMMYFSVLIAVLFAVFLSYFVPMRSASKCYVVVLTALAVYSMIAHLILRPIAEAGFLTPRIVINPTGWEFLDFGLAFPTLCIYTKSRNYGLFREPGIYQFFILMGLFLNNYRVDWQKKSSVWVVNFILAATMMTTLATGGVIEMGLFAVVLFLDKKWYREKLGRIAALTCAVGAAAVVAVLYLMKSPIFMELYLMVAKIFAGEDSVVDRVASISSNLSFFFAHPIFGGRISEVLYAVDNNTSSSTALLAIFGITGGLVHAVSYAALVWDKERFILWNLGLLVILLMSFNTENIIADPFLWLFPIMALTERLLPWIDRKRRK